MLIKDIYDKANHEKGISQKDFLYYFNDCLSTISAKYGAKFVFFNEIYQEAKTVEDELPIFPEWNQTLADYIIYKNGVGEERKTKYENNADYAYRNVWHRFCDRHRHKYKQHSWD